MYSCMSIPTQLILDLKAKKQTKQKWFNLTTWCQMCDEKHPALFYCKECDQHMCAVANKVGVCVYVNVHRVHMLTRTNGYFAIYVSSHCHILPHFLTPRWIEASDSDTRTYLLPGVYIHGRQIQKYQLVGIPHFRTYSHSYDIFVYFITSREDSRQIQKHQWAHGDTDGHGQNGQRRGRQRVRVVLPITDYDYTSSTCIDISTCSTNNTLHEQPTYRYL